MRQHQVGCHAACQSPNQMKKLNIISCPLVVVLIATLVYSKITFSAEPVKQAQPEAILNSQHQESFPPYPTHGNEKPIESTSW